MFVSSEAEGLGGLGIVEVPIPTPNQGEVLIKVHGAGINRPDIYQRKGHYPPPPGASKILGLEVSGEIVAWGPQTNHASFQMGDKICALLAGGGYAEYCVVPLAQCLRVPNGVDIVVAAGIPETFFTVWANLVDLAQLQAGETLLVHGGSSGIGMAAIQLGKFLGARVVVTAGSLKKCEACRQIGADLAINYKEFDFVQQTELFTDGKGVDVILDMVGGDYLTRNLESLAMDGRIVQIATQKGDSVSLSLRSIMKKRARLTGSTLRGRSIEEKGRIASSIETQLWPLFESGRMKVVVDKIFPMVEVAKAHAYMESGKNIGKIILSIE